MADNEPTKRADTAKETPSAVTAISRTPTRTRFIIDPAATDEEIAEALKELVTAAKARRTHV